MIFIYVDGKTMGMRRIPAKMWGYQVVLVDTTNLGSLPQPMPPLGSIYVVKEPKKIKKEVPTTTRQRGRFFTGNPRNVPYYPTYKEKVLRGAKKARYMVGGREKTQYRYVRPKGRAPTGATKAEILVSKRTQAVRRGIGEGRFVQHREVNERRDISDRIEPYEEWIYPAFREQMIPRYGGTDPRKRRRYV